MKPGNNITLQMIVFSRRRIQLYAAGVWAFTLLAAFCFAQKESGTPGWTPEDQKRLDELKARVNAARGRIPEANDDPEVKQSRQALSGALLAFNRNPDDSKATDLILQESTTPSFPGARLVIIRFIHINTKSIAVLVKMLHDGSDPSAQLKAAARLREAAANEKSVAEELQTLVRNKNSTPSLRRVAAEGLSFCATSDPQYLESLTAYAVENHHDFNFLLNFLKVQQPAIYTKVLERVSSIDPEAYQTILNSAKGKRSP